MGRSFPAIFLFFQLLIVSSQVTHSQTPNVFKYQAVVRDSTGVLIANRPIAIRSSIVADSTTGSIIYQETHSLVTNNFGLVTTDIGSGSVIIGGFNTISWENGNLFLKIEIDETGGTNFSELSTTQFQAVP